MYRPLEVNEKDGELLDTQMSKDWGVGWGGLIFREDTLFIKKKVWFNLRTHLWGRDSRTMTAAPIRMKGLVIFPSPMRALREVFSIRSPKPLVLRRVNGCFFWPLQDVWSEEEEMSCFPTKCPILRTGEYYHFLKRQRRIVDLRSCGVQGDLVLTFLPCWLLEKTALEGKE